jgi:hypothetical protein
MVTANADYDRENCRSSPALPALEARLDAPVATFRSEIDVSERVVNGARQAKPAAGGRRARKFLCFRSEKSAGRAAVPLGDRSRQGRPTPDRLEQSPLPQQTDDNRPDQYVYLWKRHRPIRRYAPV